MTEQTSREPVSVLALPSNSEGFTHDILINGDRRISVDIDSLDTRDLLELVSTSMQIGSELLLKDMGRTVVSISEEEH